MFGKMLRNHFQAMGADIRVTVAGARFEIGIDQSRKDETFQLHFPSDGSVQAKVLDGDRNRRHLVLEVVHRGLGANQRFLCGHDEYHWFVAALPDRPAVSTVSEAMEALKPRAVRTEQAHKRVKRKHRSNRRTRAYVRQGEWFFVPRPDVRTENLLVERPGRLVRGAGKPHRVDCLGRDSAGRIFAFGNVAHADHATIRLDLWHEVYRNTEVAPKELAQARQLSFVDMAYLD